MTQRNAMQARSVFRLSRTFCRFFESNSEIFGEDSIDIILGHAWVIIMGVLRMRHYPLMGHFSYRTVSEAPWRYYPHLRS